MPTTRTAEKEMRAAQRRLAHNKSTHSETKTLVTKAENAIRAAGADAAQAVKAAASALDKEAEKGSVHGNNAARRKSRLVRKLNKLTKSSK